MLSLWFISFISFSDQPEQSGIMILLLYVCVWVLTALPALIVPAQLLSCPWHKTPRQPLGPSPPSPATLQQGCSAATHRPALPGHGPHRAGPTHSPQAHILVQLLPSPVPTELPHDPDVLGCPAPG